MSDRPLETFIGVGVIVVRNGQVLLGQRLGNHGAGTWAPPGGHLEADESVEACARRELLEETGLLVQACHAGPYSVNDFPELGRRYVTLFVLVTASDGEPVVREPTKCAQWRWCTPGQWPTPLFSPVASLMQSGWQPPG